MKVRFIPASDTRENWLAKNPVALPGEICVEIDTGRWKFGDGRRPYSELPYATQDFTQEFFEMQKLAAEMQDVVDGAGGGLTEAEVIDLIGEYGTVGDFAAVDHTHEEYAQKTHSHSEYLTELPTHTHEEYLTEADLPAPVDLSEYLTELPTHTHEEYLTAADLPAPVDLSEYPTRFEVQTAVQSVADPVVVLTEAEFAAIVPDATKIYVIY